MRNLAPCETIGPLGGLITMSNTASESTIGFTSVMAWADLKDRTPHGAVAEGVDLVIIRFDDSHSVLSGRCQHRGARMADGHCVGDDLVCGVHGWDYRIDSGISTYSDREHLHLFESVILDGVIHVDRDELVAYRRRHALPLVSERTDRADADLAEFERFYDDPHVAPEEPLVAEIHELARHGLGRVGHHGPVAAMGVERDRLPRWDDLQFVTAQLARFPLLDDEPVDTSVVIGPNAAKPLRLDIPIFVSDMSFGALSQEAKTALSRGAELAGTGICSGEGGMLPEEQAENTRYFYELASARFGWRPEILLQVQAFHLKFGQGAKTGTGGHLPGPKVQGRIAQVRGLTPGTPAVSPARFPDWSSLAEIAEFVDWAKAESGGIPVGAKLSAQHVEADLDAALQLGVDYVILDGRGGGTGAAPKIFRDHISVPTMAALASPPTPGRKRPTRRHVDRHGGPAYGAGHRQGARPGSRRRGAGQLCAPGDRLRRDAGMQHRQLPGRHRNAEAGASSAAAGRRRCAAFGAIPGCDHGADHSSGAGMWPQLRRRLPARRSHDVRP